MESGAAFLIARRAVPLGYGGDENPQFEHTKYHEGQRAVSEGYVVPGMICVARPGNLTPVRSEPTEDGDIDEGRAGCEP